MKQLYYFLGIFLALAISRFIPHPPNFTSLIALSFYVPVLFGIRYMPVVLVSFVITDLIIGFHSTLFFTWGSVILIGLISKFFVTSTLKRLGGALLGACVFFIVTNFGVWSLGSYGYNLEGLIASYTLALPFFGYSAISTLIFSVLIETVMKFSKFSLKNI
tara:strand:+ start:3505 stop:3987 length:483 start_codon:yes stop_codon:yes gene_type:complete